MRKRAKRPFSEIQSDAEAAKEELERQQQMKLTKLTKSIEQLSAHRESLLTKLGKVDQKIAKISASIDQLKHSRKKQLIQPHKKLKKIFATLSAVKTKKRQIEKKIDAQERLIEFAYKDAYQRGCMAQPDVSRQLSKQAAARAELAQLKQQHAALVVQGRLWQALVLRNSIEKEELSASLDSLLDSQSSLLVWSQPLQQESKEYTQDESSGFGPPASLP